MEPIKSCELRSGNLVNDLALENPLVITAQGIAYVESGQFKVYPIPITEQWLKRFGFTKQSLCDVYWLKKEEDPLCILTNEMGTDCDEDYGNEIKYVSIESDGRSYLPIKYIHHLQNVWFMIMLKELPLD